MPEVDFLKVFEDDPLHFDYEGYSLLFMLLLFIPCLKCSWEVDRQASPVCVAEPQGSFPVQREGNILIKKNRKVKNWPA